jgi:hypothetical protein
MTPARRSKPQGTVVSSKWQDTNCDSHRCHQNPSVACVSIKNHKLKPLKNHKTTIINKCVTVAHHDAEDALRMPPGHFCFQDATPLPLLQAQPNFGPGSSLVPHFDSNCRVPRHHTFCQYRSPCHKGVHGCVTHPCTIDTDVPPWGTIPINWKALLSKA